MTRTVGRPDAAPLAGVTVGVTAVRRADEFSALLTRRGATVMRAPTVEFVDNSNDDGLRRATEGLIAAPPDFLVVTTSMGLRGWLAAAAEWGRADELVSALGAARILARGPKAVGAIRAAGLREEFSPVSESSAEVVDLLREEGIRDRRVAVQLHGSASEWEPLPDLAVQLRALGADVTGISVYRWHRHPDTAPIDVMIAATVAGDLDALTYTSAPAAAAMLSRARELGTLDEFIAALRTDVPVFCVGATTAGPFDALGIPVAYPDRFRLSALARLVVEELSARP